MASTSAARQQLYYDKQRQSTAFCYFGFINQDFTGDMFCSKCFERYGHSTSIGNLLNHLRTKHSIHDDCKDQKELANIADFFKHGGDQPSPRLKRNPHLTVAVYLMVTVDLLPFQTVVVECRGFRTFFAKYEEAGTPFQH